MKISVIIPAYNSSETIIDAIQSVESQVLLEKNIAIEIIIVNDGSSDCTERVVSDYIKHCKSNIKLYSKINGGVSSARNLGIMKATGDWIAFLDSDDIWLENKIQNQIEIINKYSNVNFIGCARNNEKLTILGRDIEYIYKAKCDDLLLKMFPQTSTALVKKSILDEVGYYDETMTHSEDGELWIRICSKGGFYYLPESLVLTGGGKENFGASGLSSNLNKMYEGNIKILGISLKDKRITYSKYILLRFFYFIKHVRRLLIVKIR